MLIKGALNFVHAVSLQKRENSNMQPLCNKLEEHQPLVGKNRDFLHLLFCASWVCELILDSALHLAILPTEWNFFSDIVNPSTPLHEFVFFILHTAGHRVDKPGILSYNIRFIKCLTWGDNILDDCYHTMKSHVVLLMVHIKVHLTKRQELKLWKPVVGMSRRGAVKLWGIFLHAWTVLLWPGGELQQWRRLVHS